MSDQSIEERLRVRSEQISGPNAALLVEAADEIARLRKEVDEAMAASSVWQDRAYLAEADAKALREALTRVIEWQGHNCERSECESGCPYEVARALLSSRASERESR